MTQRYEEVSNCRLFKVILYFRCREVEITRASFLGYTRVFSQLHARLFLATRASF